MTAWGTSRSGVGVRVAVEITLVGGRTRRDHLDRIELVGAGHRAAAPASRSSTTSAVEAGAGDQSPQRLLRREPSHHSRRVHGRYLGFGPHLNAGLASELPDRIRERLGWNAEVAPDQGVALRVRDGDRGPGVLVEPERIERVRSV